MAKACPFSETSRCRDRDETEALDLRDQDETETLKNSVSRLFRDRDMSRDTTALIIIAYTYFYFLACITYIVLLLYPFSGKLLFETVTILCSKNCQK